MYKSLAVVNPPTPQRGDQGVSNFYLSSHWCGYFPFQLRAGGHHSGRIVPDIFGHLPDSGAKSEHVTWSKFAEKMTRSKKLLFFTILGIFGPVLVNAKPFLDPKQIPRTYISVHFEEGHNTLVSHHFFDNFSQWSAVKVDENAKTRFFENHCFS